MAVVAVLVGAAATFAIQEWRAERSRREVILTRYLAQLQDACESLWFRLKNLAYDKAASVSTPEYLVTTTMYTLGRVLGIERTLALEGLYPEIWKRFPELEPVLRRRVVDDAVSAATKQAKELQQYDRVALAEAAVERDGAGFRQSTFLEFRTRVDGAERSWWAPARASVAELEDNRTAVEPLMTTLKQLTDALGKITEMTTEFPDLKSGPAARA